MNYYYYYYDDIEPTPPRPHPVVPQTGTWQIQDTVPKAYIMVSFDDDNPSIATDAYIVSTYGIPPIINTEAENVNKNLASVPEWGLTNPTSTDVNKKVVSIGGEVALHGGSGWRLWNSEAVTDEMWNTWYNTYVSNGGELGLNEFKLAFLAKYSGNDLTQNATMFLANRNTIENAIGSPVMTIGAWGGNGITNIDGHDVVNINQMPVNKATVETWARENNFSANSQLVGYQFSDYPYYIYRNVPDDSKHGVEAKAWIDRSISDYSVIEIFSHGSGNGTNPSVNTLRTICQYIKDKVDEGKAVAITRKGYAELGEFVDDSHLVVSLDCTIPIVKVGDDWSNPDIVATFKDGHTAVVNGSVIGTVDTTTAGTYPITLYYHGIKASKNVIVENEFNLPDFNASVVNYYIYQDKADPNKMYCGASSGAITSLSISGASIIAYTTSGKKVWNYVSVDGGLTWTAVCSNKTVYGNYKSTDSAWWGDSTYLASAVQLFRDITNV